MVCGLRGDSMLHWLGVVLRGELLLVVACHCITVYIMVMSLREIFAALMDALVICFAVWCGGCCCIQCCMFLCGQV